MIWFFLSFGWGIVIVLSMVGWGGVINRVLFSEHRLDWGQKAAWGVAFSILAGGVLNLTWAISRAVILVYLGTGLLCWIFDTFKRGLSGTGLVSKRFNNYREDKTALVGLLIVVFLVLFQYSGWVTHKPFDPNESIWVFNCHDDFHAYFVYPEKMLQAGSMGQDPFSARRVASSLGGQSFLHTFVLCILSEKNLNIIDPGLGMMIAVGLLLGYSRERGVSRMAAMFVIIFLLVIPVPKANISALMTALALFISLLRTFDWEGLRPERFAANAFIVALLASAVCALKSSYIPACGILFALSYVFYIIKSKTKGKAICEFFTATVLAGIFLLPWMISMYQSSGTLLYPLLGKGWHGSVYGTFLLPTAGLTSSWVYRIIRYHLTSPYIVSLMLLGSVSFSRRCDQPGARWASLSAAVSALLGALIISVATGGRGGDRFYFSFVVAAITVLMIIAMSGARREAKGRFANYTFALVAVLTAGIVIGSNWHSMLWFYPKSQYAKCIWNIKASTKNLPLIPKREVARHIRMQQSIPEGEVVLARLATPFLLDFKRNKIFVIDIPGGASPPPGMPSFKGPEALADYLTSNSVRYVAYSYAKQAFFARERFGDRLRSGNPWVRTEAEHTFDFQDNIVKLGQTRSRIYDDGYIFVLDLSKRRGGK